MSLTPCPLSPDEPQGRGGPTNGYVGKVNTHAIEIRLERPGEEATAYHIVREAFGEERPALLLNEMRKSDAWRGLSFFAVSGGDPVAHVSYTRGWVDAPSRLVEVLILSPMSVLPAWQRKGIGTRLIHESLASLAETRPEPVVFLEGDPAFYSRCGFTAGAAHGFGRPSDRIPEPGFQCFLLPSYEASVCGRLVYPDVFWRLECVGLRA